VKDKEYATLEPSRAEVIKHAISVHTNTALLTFECRDGRVRNSSSSNNSHNSITAAVN
jgi:hypothetical protein